jgi:hypothetical protein
VIVLRLKSVEEMCHSPTVYEFRQRKLGTIIIRTVHILQHDNADTGSLPEEDFHESASSKNVNHFEFLPYFGKIITIQI